MQTLHRGHGSAVLLDPDDKRLHTRCPNSHHAVLQVIDGPCRVTLPRRIGAHFLIAGQLTHSILGRATRVSAGTLQVSDGQVEIVMQVPAHSRASLMHFYFGPAWIGQVVGGRGAHRSVRAHPCPLLPVRHEPSSSGASVMARLANRLGALAVDQGLDAMELHGYFNDLVKAREEFDPHVARCPGYNQVHRLDLFLRLSRARELLLYGIDRSITIDEVAQCASVSPAHFTRQFQRVFGMPPHRYRLRHLMQQAYVLLTEHRLGVADVISNIGMAGHCEFARAFKRQFGKCATQVRAETLEAP